MAERFPALSHAEGPDIRVRPLRADDHAALFAAAADPLIWAQHPSQDRHTAVGFKRWFDQALGDGALLVENRSTGAALGSSRFYDWSPGTREVAIGHTFLVRACGGGSINAQLKRLMRDHAFRHADTVWFHVAVGNHRSRRAMEKIGGVLDRDDLHGGQPYHFFRISRPSAPAPP